MTNDEEVDQSTKAHETTFSEPNKTNINNGKYYNIKFWILQMNFAQQIFQETLTMGRIKQIIKSKMRIKKHLNR